MVQFLEWLSLFLLTCFKFSFGVPAAYLTFGLNFWQTFLFAFAGGTTGVFLNLYLSRFLFLIWFAIRERIMGSKAQEEKAKKKKIFSKRSRLMVTLLRKYGLPGLALITPPLISIPAGCIIATKLYGKSPKVLSYMILSVFFWSLLFASLLNLV
jgi:hypothetical protein